MSIYNFIDVAGCLMMQMQGFIQGIIILEYYEEMNKSNANSLTCSFPWYEAILQNP